MLYNDASKYILGSEFHFRGCEIPQLREILNILHKQEKLSSLLVKLLGCKKGKCVGPRCVYLDLPSLIYPGDKKGTVLNG